MKVLVTGARGQIAQSLVERSRSRSGIELVAVGRPALDLEEPGSVDRLISAEAPDIVINAAAYTAVDDAEGESECAFQVNSDGAGEIARAAAKSSAAVIHISTDYVFDGSSADPYDEDAAPNPINIYGKSKLAGEERVRSANPRHIIVRTAWVYSAFAKNFVKTMMRAAESRDRLEVVSDQLGTPSSASDVAEGLLRMIEAGPRFGETYHLAGTGRASWYEFAVAIMAECRKRGLPSADVEPIASADWPAAARRPANSALNSCKFKGDFGYAMPRWEDSLSDVIDRLPQLR